MSNQTYGANLTVVIPVGGGKRLQKQGLRATRAVQNTDHKCLVVFCSDENYNKEVKNKIKNNADLFLETNIPVESHKESFKVKSMLVAERNITTEYTLLVDTDTIILEEVDFDLSESDIALKPVDIGSQFWCSDEAEKYWQKFIKQYTFSNFYEKSESTVDNKEIRPYYNAGFILTRTNYRLGKKWLRLVKEINKDFPELPNREYIDQISLALICQNYNVMELDEVWNFPLPHRSSGSNIGLIHYHSDEHLLKFLLSPFFTQKRNVIKCLPSKDFLSLLFNPLNWIRLVKTSIIH